MQANHAGFGVDKEKLAKISQYAYLVAQIAMRLGNEDFADRVDRQNAELEALRADEEQIQRLGFWPKFFNGRNPSIDRDVEDGDKALASYLVDFNAGALAVVRVDWGRRIAEKEEKIVYCQFLGLNASEREYASDKWKEKSERRDRRT